MVLVEDLRGLLDVVEVVRGHVPGQADQPVHVGPDDADLWRGGGDPAHPVDFLQGARLDLVGHAGGLDLLAKLVDLCLLRVLLTQLALDGLHLLAQDVLALGLVHLRLHFGLDPTLELVDLDLVGEERGGDLQPLGNVDRLEQLLALLRGHVRGVRGHVREQARLGDVAGRDGRLWRHRGAGLNVLLDLGLNRAHQRLDLDVRRRLLGQLLDAGADERLGLREAVHAHAGLALDDRPDRPVLELDDLGDLGHRPDAVQLARIGDVLLVGLALGHQRDAAALGHGGIEGRDALLPADLQRHDHLREDHGLAERDERQLRDRDGVLVVRVGRLLRHRFSYWFVVRGVSAASGFGGRGGRGPFAGSDARGVPVGFSFGVQALEDPGSEALLELEQDAHAGEIDAEVLGQVANPRDPPDVVLRIQPDVGRRSRRADEALFLVDPQRSRMHADDARRHADDVDGSLRVAIWSGHGHRRMLETYQRCCQDSSALRFLHPVPRRRGTGETRKAAVRPGGRPCCPQFMRLRGRSPGPDPQPEVVA